MTDITVYVSSAKERKRGRRSSFEGCMIRCLIDWNPRRKKSSGFKSLQILLDAGEPILYEEFMARGGNRRDLVWDIQYGRVEIVGDKNV